MSSSTDHISFEVETSRVLEILSKEIYDSPLAMLRENVQNAYDAILMRASLQDLSIDQGQIAITIAGPNLAISDNGIGMTEETLRANFWKAGSSGKRTELARRSGVIGTFGIGAMANFGVSTMLRVETKHVDCTVTLISTAKRDTLSIAHECIELERIADNRQPGTIVSVVLDPRNLISVDQAINYLEPYVKYLPVPVRVNQRLISQQPLEDGYLRRTKDFHPLTPQSVQLSAFRAIVDPFVDSNGVVACRVRDISIDEQPVQGQVVLLQQGGQLMALRSFFGLAPAPVNGVYQLGGIANLTILHPTAGREALSRESIEYLNNLVSMAEFAITERLADTDLADRNSAFLQYILNNNKIAHAKNVTIDTQPLDKSITLAAAHQLSARQSVQYYTGRDSSTIHTFGSEQTPLLCVSQSNPRRKLQLRYLQEIAKIPEVPDRARVLKEFAGPDLSYAEAAFLIRVGTTLNEDYLLSNAEARFAEISHGVSILVEKVEDVAMIYIARSASEVAPVVNCFRTAPEVFSGFVKDFVRVHLYKRITEYVPSSTRQGADALYKILQRNRELFRYEESELGEIEPLLADYLGGGTSLGDVLKMARTHARPQTVRVRSAEVGQVEQAMPDVLTSPATPEAGVDGVNEFDAVPSIMRPDLECEMKILLVGGQYPQLNNVELFLGLSDRLFRRESEFFRSPHTTRVIWAGHRIIYIFGHASGKLTLYYDIELRDPLEQTTASGRMLPTTTLFTKKRIYVPVPAELISVFRISEGAKEFFVRFDTVISELQDTVESES